MLRWLKYDFFHFFANFWMTKLKPFSGKGKQIPHINSNLRFSIASILENYFETTLRPKANVLSVWKWLFQSFANFWVTKLKLFSGKVRQSFQNYLNPKSVKKHFIKWFWNCLKLKSKCSEDSNKAFFGDFWVMKLKLFIRQARQSFQNYLNPKLIKVSILENGFEATLRWNTNVLRVEKCQFSLFGGIFEWLGWKCFPGKLRKAFKSV